MRARNRHSASNYLFAAFLELVLMATFVVIAQPQLRQSLFELLEPSPGSVAVPGPDPSATRTAATTDPSYGVDYPVTHFAIGSTVAADSSSASSHSLASTGQHAGWSMTTAGYTPFDQFESFAVSSSGEELAVSRGVASGPNHAAEKRVAGYAPTVGATQLGAIDWNIASAGRPLSPTTGWPTAGWTSGGSTVSRPVSRPAEADYRDAYPPPYGTQSQWK